MKKFLSIIITSAALSAAFPLGAFAAEKKMSGGGATEKATAKTVADRAPETAPTAPSAVKALPYRGDVAAVDPAMKTFTFKSLVGKERVFTVTDSTMITKDGNKADFSALTMGAYATGQYHKTADGKLEAVSVKIGPKPEKKKKGAA